MDRFVFHIDVNSAFLSWEASRRVAMGEPDLRLIPSCIGGDPKKRTGIVVAKSIPAKKYGITTGEPMSQALRKCPNLVVVPGDFKLYTKCSKAFKAICQEYTPAMESFSIDEVFLDMTGMELIYPDLIAAAYQIKDRIREELGFTVNVGIGRNKLCAKMASDFEKPDKVHTLFPEEIPEKMWPLDVGELFTCGKSSAERLRKEGIRTIGDLAHADVVFLQRLLGDMFFEGDRIEAFREMICSDTTEEREEAKGYSTETTVEEDLVDLESIHQLMLAQADVLAARLRADGAKCGCVGVTYRTIEWKNRSHQRKLSDPTDVTEEIVKVAGELMEEGWNREPLRLVGIALTEIDRSGMEQMSFFADERQERLKKLDSAIDSIRGRFGNASVQRASVAAFGRNVGRKAKAQMEERNGKN